MRSFIKDANDHKIHVLSVNDTPNNPFVTIVKYLTILLFITVLLGGCAKSVHMYAITTWTSECPGSSRAWDDMIDQWYFEMEKHGHTLERRFVDGAFNRALLCDENLGLADCADTQYADAGNFVMIGLHGSRSGKHWRGSLRDNGGASVMDCRIDAPEGNEGELYLGNNDTIFLHLSSCNSMDDDSMPEVWRMFQDPINPVDRPGRLHGVTGFHGMMGIGGTYHEDYRSFAELAQTISIKDAWMDTMYHPEMDNVKCPVAYSVGVTGEDCFNRIDNESYKDINDDPDSIGYYCYYYYENCDPALEGPFTPPE